MAHTLRKRLGPLIFGFTLLAFAALTVHWVTLLWRHERSGFTDREQALNVAAHRMASQLGSGAVPPLPGKVADAPDLEVVALPEVNPPPGVVRLYPRWRHLGVLPRAEIVSSLRSQQRLRVVMLVGEGALAVLLLGILALMLYRLLVSERQRRREIEEFISTVSHELKTPLAGIKALLGTLQLGYIPPERLSETLEMGLRETDRLEHLVENLVIANRIRRSLLVVDLRPVDLEVFLGEFRRHRETLLPEGLGGFQVDVLSARGVHILADVDKLRVILENLTDNAIKYGAEGEVRIGVRPLDERVTVDVVDHGVGFSPQEAEALFEGRRANTSAQGSLVHGTGLGLTIARHLTRAMGGDIEAHSDGPGRGSRFSVILPRAPEDIPS